MRSGQPVFSERVRASVVALTLLLGAAAGADETVKRYEKPRKIGALQSRALPECSGVVAGRRNPSLLWVHNDSGDSGRIFAIEHTGTLFAEVVIDGAANTDWEDIAIGPGPTPGESFLYIADTGSNDRTRREYALYRVPEPSLKDRPPGKRWKTRPATRIRFRYSGDRGHDCEAVVVHPSTGDAYLFTKAPLEFEVYRLKAPLDDKRVLVAKPVGKMRSDAFVTAADVSADGKRLALRSYLAVYEYVLPKDAKTFEAILRAPSYRVATLLERQGEALCYDGKGSLLSISEGVGAPIFEIPRKK